MYIFFSLSQERHPLTRGLFLKKKKTNSSCKRNFSNDYQVCIQEHRRLDQDRVRETKYFTLLHTLCQGMSEDQPGKHCYWLDGCFDSLTKGGTHYLVSRSWYSSSKSKHFVLNILCWPSAVHSAATGSWASNVRQWWVQIKTSKGNGGKSKRNEVQVSRYLLPGISHTGTHSIFSAAIWYVTTLSKSCHQGS